MTFHTAWPFWSNHLFLTSCSPLGATGFIAGSYEILSYVLIQEIYPFTWIQLLCTYRWLLLAASLSPDLLIHPL